MERETTTIKTPLSGIEVVLKAYLTGREKRDITNASIPAKINYAGASESIDDIDLVSIMNAGENAVLKNIILSIGGNTDSATFVDTVLDMRSEDSDFILEEVKKVADALTTEKKTK